MAFYFETRGTHASASLKLWSFWPVTYADMLAHLFLYTGVVALVVAGASLVGFGPLTLALSLAALFFCLCLVFFEIYFFSRFLMQPPAATITISQALANPEQYNLAEFLTIESCAIVEYAIAACKRRRLSRVPSEALLYAGALRNNDIKVLLARLGIDSKKLSQDVKNYLEKQDRQQTFKLLLAESFEKTIFKAAAVASERGLAVISEKELLVALAYEDAFLKKVLVEKELKAKDVDNLTLWLASLEANLAQRKQFWTRENLARLGSLGKDWASGFTVTLDQFAIDWTAINKRAVFAETIGHQKEVAEVETVLAKSSLKNALLVGAEGSGRKSIVEAVARRAYLDESLPELNRKRLIELDMVSLLAKTQETERVEMLLDQIFREVVFSENVILIIDDLENFVENKVVRPGTIDISGILSKYLAMPSFQCIAIASNDGLHRKLENNPSFLEYFTKIEVAEISEHDTINILQNTAIALEQKSQVLVLYPAIREIVNLTGRYLPSDPFPKKAINVLQEAVSYVKSQKGRVVEPSHIAKIISDKTQIPVGKMEFKEKSVLLNLENLIHERIINQKEAVTEIAIAMRRARSGISNKKRPMGVFLFLGPTGVGKTETAKALAQIYFGGEDKMIRLDMSEFQSVADIPRLLGAVGQNEQQGILTTQVREHPFSLVLLDEIEKAHIDILNLFLQVFDDGYVTDGQGRKVMFSNTIIICTSNAGAPEIFKSVEAGEIIKRDALLDGLFARGTFKPEFVNRFDASIIFHPLTPENLMDIAELMCKSLAKNLQEKEIELIITPAVKEKIVALSYKPQFGAREMRRVMQDTIENNIADAMLKDQVVKGNKIEINPENFQVVVIK